MQQCKITVLKKTFHEDLAKDYFLNDEIEACSCFEVGQEFIAESPQKAPDDFPCAFAWADISGLVLVLLSGGGFGPSSWKWMKNDRTMITCCTDGVRPVVFRLELLEE